MEALQGCICLPLFVLNDVKIACQPRFQAKAASMRIIAANVDAFSSSGSYWHHHYRYRASGITTMRSWDNPRDHRGKQVWCNSKTTSGDYIIDPHFNACCYCPPSFQFALVVQVFHLLGPCCGKVERRQAGSAAYQTAYPHL